MENPQEDLYREVIMDHFKNPRNKGLLPEPQIKVKGVNPFCGDELELTLDIKDGRVVAVGIETQGCAISKASSSMMAEVLTGKPAQVLTDWVAFLKTKLVDGSADAWPAELEELKAIEGVRNYAARVKCALLPWNTLVEGLQEFAAQKGGKVTLTHTEEAS
ncbi:MAG: Fe-S cluster assembly sulfur transfer protein SufU [Elusimicrobiota bacterium]